MALAVANYQVRMSLVYWKWNDGSVSYRWGVWMEKDGSSIINRKGEALTDRFVCRVELTSTYVKWMSAI